MAGQSAGVRKADGAYQGIGQRSVFGAVGAECFAFGEQLNMNLKTDNGLIGRVHGWQSYNRQASRLRVQQVFRKVSVRLLARL
jgi:hypothetical protein